MGDSDNALQQLVDVTRGPVIAVDLDDVLAQTHMACLEWHNAEYGTDMKISDFLYYHFWKNPYWGTPRQTIDKIKQFYASGALRRFKPIVGSKEGVEGLRKLGFSPVVVTARETRELRDTKAWVDEHYPGLFDGVVCTGNSFTYTDESSREVSTKLDKTGACRALRAVLLIDDALENALTVASATPPTRALLFSPGPWNHRLSEVRASRPAGTDNADEDKDNAGPDAKHNVDVTQMSYDERCAHEGGRAWWEDDEKLAQERMRGKPLVRVDDWEEVVRWVEEHKKELTDSAAAVDGADASA